MKKSRKQKTKGFDAAFDSGERSIDFSAGIPTEGLSKLVRLPPIEIPAYLAAEIDKLAKLQGNSRAAVIRQLLLSAIEARHGRRIS